MPDVSNMYCELFGLWCSRSPWPHLTELALTCTTTLRAAFAGLGCTQEAAEVLQVRGACPCGLCAVFVHGAAAVRGCWRLSGWQHTCRSMLLADRSLKYLPA